jgi:hypothetical protein
VLHPHLNALWHRHDYHGLSILAHLHEQRLFHLGRAVLGPQRPGLHHNHQLRQWSEGDSYRLLQLGCFVECRVLVCYHGDHHHLVPADDNPNIAALPDRFAVLSSW